MTRGMVPRVGRPGNAEAAAREGPQGRVIRALGHRTRRQILLLLDEGDQAVHELADHFDVSRPMISKHLRVLVQAGLVEGRRAGRERRYRLQGGAAATTAVQLARADETHHDTVKRLRTHLEGRGHDQP